MQCWVRLMAAEQQERLWRLLRSPRRSLEDEVGREEAERIADLVEGRRPLGLGRRTRRQIGE